MGDGTTYDIAVIGGTGPQGRGLGYRWARHGHRVVLGSRSAERAEQTAAEISDRLHDARVTGATNADAVADADVVVLSVPYDGHDDLVASLADRLAGKVVVSCVNPLGFDKQGPYSLDVPGGSAAETAAALAPEARVVGAFHHVSAPLLWGDADYLDHEDVLVCGDDADAKQVAIELARAVTSRDGVDAGRLRIARQLEPWTAVLISINKRYKTRSGIAVSGLPR
ncbi:MAG: NADPH-dependent F420 reductase [Nocardioidaceae bacterium]|nr:NADPH-dependent F420 reductase [Nocardioidaceae bacterium]NUS51676.1 NADPH-dependent F420 reductase [Nocardioidaceae bacterium]